MKELLLSLFLLVGSMNLNAQEVVYQGDLSQSMQYDLIVGTTLVKVTKIYSVYCIKEKGNNCYSKIKTPSVDDLDRIHGYIIPANVTKIAKGAFSGISTSPQAIFFREGQTLEIADGAFDGIVSTAFVLGCNIYEETPSSVRTLELDDISDREEVGRYNVNGMKIPDETKGLQIIQYNDGTAQKVVGK